MKPNRLYDGQELNQQNFNSIIDLLSGLENRELLISDLEATFQDGSDFAGSSIQFVRDGNDNITSFVVFIQEKTDRTPFFSTDNTTFENEDVILADTDSDFQVLSAEDGLVIDSVNYIIRDNGQVVFVNPHSSNTILVSGLIHTKQKEYFIGRNDDNQIIKVSMEPLGDVITKKRQRLMPDLASTSDVVTVWGKNVSTNAYDMFWEEDSNNVQNYGGDFTLNSDRTAQFFIDFKEPLLLSDFSFKRSAINEQSGTLFSFDVYGSNSQGVFQRILRVRNLTNSTKDLLDGKFHFEIPTPRAFKTLRFDILDWGSTDDTLKNFTLFGYHPRDIDLRYTENVMGRLFAYNDTFNGTFKISEDTISSTNFKPASIYTFGTEASILDGEHFTMEFVEPVEVHKYRFQYVGGAEQPPQRFKLYGSNDAVNWIVQGDHSVSSWATYETKEFELEKPRVFKYYRFELVDSVAGGAYLKMFMLHGSTK